MLEVKAGDLMAWEKQVTVNEYIEKQKPVQKKLLNKALSLFKKTIPGITIEYKWGVIALNEGKFYLAALKEKIHVGFSITGLSEKEISEFEGTGKTMRHIKIHSLGEFDEIRLTKLIKLVHKKAKCVEC